ncbi:MAG: SdpI family protein [Roseburia inulinivorans]
MVLVVYFDMRLYYSSDYDNCGQNDVKHCPKKINGVVGYQTKMSMINMDTWRFAHDHAGKLWWKVGIGLLGPTGRLYIFLFIGASDDTMGILSIIIIVIQLVFLIGSIFPTEKALKNNFNEDGTKR